MSPLNLRLPRASVRRPLAAVALLGPGLVAANAGNDAGGVATYSAAGASYGYQLLWVMVLITVALIVIQEMAARMGAVTGKGLSDLIRERFGVAWGLFAMLSLAIANTALVVSEFAGIAAAGELVGVPRWLSAPIAAALIWLLVLRGTYRRVEQVFLAFTFVFLAYPVTALMAHPDWGRVLHDTVAPTLSFKFAYLYILIATIGTSITPYMQLFLQSAVAEKAQVGTPRYRADVVVGSGFSNLISACIIIATGATLFLAGISVNTASDAARALQPLAGSYATLAFAVGLFGASALAAAVLPLATAYSVAEAFGFEAGMGYSFREAPVFLGLFSGLIAVGALIAIIPGLPLFQVLILAQVINGILLPIVLVFMLRLVNDPLVMGSQTNGRIGNLVAWSTVVAVSALSVALLAITALQWIGVRVPGT